MLKQASDDMHAAYNSFQDDLNFRRLTDEDVLAMLPYMMEDRDMLKLAALAIILHERQVLRVKRGEPPRVWPSG